MKKILFLIFLLCLNYSEAKPFFGQTQQVYKFSLTECNGKSLKKPATFYLNTKSTRWTLNFNNGDIAVYNILAGNKQDPLCGLDAVNSFGDKCTICITPGSSGQITIIFNYSGKRMTYKGSKI